jgi:hypothetical protein
MSIRLGTTDPSALRLGTTAVSKLMIGNTLVWSGAFDPLSLSPALWLDASDASTLYSDTAGTTLAGSNVAVARWNDKSGNARHATQSISGNRPLRKTSTLNSRDVLRFDGVDDGLFGALVHMSELSLFVVFKPTLTSLSTSAFARVFTGRAIGQTNDFTSSVFIPIVRTSTTGSSFGVFNGTFHAAINSTSETTEVRSVVHTGSNVTHRRNGTGDSSSTQSLPTSIFAEYGVGCLIGTTTNGKLLGDIAEIIVYPTALSTANRQAVESYLGAKWGIIIA